MTTTTAPAPLQQPATNEDVAACGAAATLPWLLEHVANELAATYQPTGWLVLGYEDGQRACTVAQATAALRQAAALLA